MERFKQRIKELRDNLQRYIWSLTMKELKKLVQSLIIENLPGFLQPSATREPYKFKNSSSKALDIITFNKETGCYERLFIELSSIDNKYLISIQFALSLLSEPLIPAHPPSWYGHVMDIDLNDDLVELWWSNSWLEIGEEHDYQANLKVIFDFLDEKLFLTFEHQARKMI